MSLYERAQTKIMKAYGPESQILTTLDIAAMAHSLSCSYWEKCLGISSNKNIDEFAHNLSLSTAAEHFVTSVYVDLYADKSGISNSRRSVPDTYEELIKWREWYKTTTDPIVVAERELNQNNQYAFKNRLQRMIERNPEKYKCETIEEFCERIQWNPMLRDKPKLIRELPALAMISGALDARRMDLQLLLKSAEAVNSDLHYARMNARIKPVVGPDTEDELLVTIILMSAYAEARKISGGFIEEDELSDILIDIRELMSQYFFSHSVIDSLELEAKRAEINPRLSHTDRFLEAGFTANDCLIYTLGMTRYYYAYHQDKLTREQSKFLRELMMAMYKIVYQKDNDQEKPFIEGKNPKNASSQDDDSQIVQEFSLFAAHEQKPTVDYIKEQMKANMPSEKWLEANAILERAGPYLNLQVSYFVGQDGDIKKVKRDSFNGNKDRLGISEVIKESFIRWAVSVHEDELKAAGFDDELLDRMLQFGKIESAGLLHQDRWTVDHIVDIQTGGMNNFSNLCIMPAWLNLDKSRFLELQLKGNQTGQWVLTLRPKRNLNGDYSIIVSPSSEALKTTVPINVIDLLEYKRKG